MTNKKNEHVLYLEERIEWLEDAVIRLTSMVENTHNNMLLGRRPNHHLHFSGVVSEYHRIQNKLPVKKNKESENEGGRA